MLPLTDLQFQILDLVWRNVNQHQALALAPLYSTFHFVVKRKLYNHTYIYNDATDWGWLLSLGTHKQINNRKSSRLTIVSLSNLEKYISAIDANQSILVFEIRNCFQALLEFPSQCFLKRSNGTMFLRNPTSRGLYSSKTIQFASSRNFDTGWNKMTLWRKNKKVSC